MCFFTWNSDETDKPSENFKSVGMLFTHSCSRNDNDNCFCISKNLQDPLPEDVMLNGRNRVVIVGGLFEIDE